MTCSLFNSLALVWVFARSSSDRCHCCCLSFDGCVVGRVTVGRDGGDAAAAAVHIEASWLGDVVVVATIRRVVGARMSP